MKHLIIAIALILTQGTAAANLMSQDYMQLSIGSIKSSGKGSAFQSMRISKQIDKNLYFSAYSENMFSTEKTKVYGGGLGVQIEINDNNYAFVAAEHQKRNGEQGTSFKVGLYSYAHERMAVINYISFSSVNVDTYLSLSSELRYYINIGSSIGLKAKSEHSNYQSKTISSISLRVEF